MDADRRGMLDVLREVRFGDKAPGDFPSGSEGDVLTVQFTMLGIPCLGLNGGP